MKLFLQNLLCVCLILITLIAAAETNEKLPAGTTLMQVQPGQVNFDLPLFDLPANTTTYYPNLYSLRQSLVLSTDFYETAHALIGGADPGAGRKWIIIGFDFFTGEIPLSMSWMHEEWHRAVMSSRGIGSFNDVNTLPIGKSLIAVSHVDDNDLIALKQDHPADQVRLSAAGMESQIQQNELIEQHHFFQNTKSHDRFLIWMNNANVTFYMNECASTHADKSTDQQNAEDGQDILKRDFTGLDCTAWAYDLFRPDEPYQARGLHPSGVGINRYIHFSSLSPKEKDFLSLQARLSFLNFADPFLFNKDYFSDGWFGKSIRWNAKLSHYITSFGATVDTVVFVKTESNKYLLIVHNGMTDTRYLPGISFEQIEKPLPWNSFSLSMGITIWPQPKDQRVETVKLDTMAYGSSQLLYQISSQFSAYMGLTAKTAGWMAGDVFLDRNVSVQAGIRSILF